ncbi:MAG: aminoacyl-tRNA hydrolase [Hyphomicrobiaceae bacterium]|nr:aminoacyl-tRNA hydrolase [Hyphomicrobiaceae bacterium]
MKLFVGLGNPGAKYARNRHNVGFMAVDRIAVAHNAEPWRRKFQGHAAEVTIGGEKVLLLKPDTFMNESGRAVGEAARFHKVPIGDIVVLYDEIDLAPGKLKVKTGGGNAGHNGLRSISAHLDNDYVRVRIGVGHPGHKDQVANYVLNDFAKADRVWLEPLLDAIAGAAARLVTGSNERFLTDVALALGNDDAKVAPAKATPAGPRREGPAEEVSPQARRSGGHPAGERASKRHSALAENLRKWMGARNKSEQ